MRDRTPSKARSRGRRRIAALLLSGLLLGGAVISGDTPFVEPPAAGAMQDLHGPGVNWGNGVHMKGAGAFIVGGKNVYCTEIWIVLGSEVPDYVTTGTIPAKSVGGVSVAATTGVPLKQIAYIMSKYGQTTDNAQAAAVALAIWEIRGADGRGDAGYQEELAWTRASVGPGVVALAHWYIDEAAQLVAALATGGGVELQITRAPDSPYRGSVAVPAGTTTLTIEHGVFGDGTSTRTWGADGAPVGTSLSWEGRPPASAGWDRYYRVGFSGEYLAFSETVKWGNGGGWQSSIMSDEPVRRPLRASHIELDTRWAPTVSSEVTERFLAVGEQFSDTITFAPGASGLWRWREGAEGALEWMPVKAKGTVYGPFLSDPALNPAPEAPIGAPVAATIEVTTQTNRDHSTPQRYEVTLPEQIPEQGYYTFKWDIDGADQDSALTGADDCLGSDAIAGCRVLSTDYFYSDGFGAAGETQVGKMRPRFSTLLSAREVGLGQAFTDDIAVDAMQNWLRGSDGSRLPLTLIGTAYLMPGAELAQSTEVPETAVPFATIRVTTDPGSNGQTLTSEALAVPVSASPELTHVTMRWCVVNAEQQPQSQGVWEESCDDFGIPAESARVLRPVVRTEATPLATVYDPLGDTAIVDGMVPPDSEMVFELFRRPAGGAVACNIENRVARTGAVSVASGWNDGVRYNSPQVFASEPGTYWWVELLLHRDPGTGEETVIHEGACGLPNETTTIGTPSVTTRAQASVRVGENARDTAIVAGPLPRPGSGITAVLTFEVFEKTGDRVSCDESNLVHRLDEVVVVTSPGEYASGDVRFETAGVYYWVEELSYVHEDGSREVVHRGECGLPNETTEVQPRVLAVTGAPAVPLAFGLPALLLAAGGIALVVYSRRKPGA